ncbi:asparagine synthase (glutamine-hydrolyzing) [Thalassospira tepidiphila]|jgi:asparagine synthase (glutamine-hydrolysing)|uniref:asparagine synthase (glutamine-hydrolyzing) n=1 Tax=Thalassospira tepidiphila TaxID=393657 RepID=UPI001BCE352E|nr:asparagine synthase (glutamine-hydrolyzing) [Thalassospira tepidiphila]MBS8273466.1 asparagine synthase (glutamine-hydrolyzing) [Thalassospira tepidiphila]
MCGVAGFVFPDSKLSEDYLKSLLKSMGAAISYRGPDAEAFWVDAHSGVGMVHRRLSIIDLSPAGNQPMLSHDGRFVMVYNGEIYNSEAIREELISCGVSRFNGHSDTEVILEAISYWGIEVAFKKTNGMFACAVWDCKEAKLSLVRDRLGIKPLYWCSQNGRVFFASELKALYANPEWKGEIDLGTLASYLRHSYIQGPGSIHKGVNKLRPGSIVTIEPSSGKTESQFFWEMCEVVQSGYQNPFEGNEKDVVDELEALLSDSVRRQMVSDVPVGAFLSGGIDSSTVVALMQANSDRPVKTFSIGFDEVDYNEARHASAVAKHLGTDHSEWYMTSQDALDVVPKLANMFDEPFADSSQIPTYLVSAMTRKHVTVALSGDGGDELFAGYSRYLQTLARYKSFQRVPRHIRFLVSRALRLLPGNTLSNLQRSLSIPSARPNLGDKLNLLGDLLSDDGLALYRQTLTHWANPDQVIAGGQEVKGLLWSSNPARLTSSMLKMMMYLDTCTYLPDDILTKVDRASMAVSLEARVPLLDHRVVEFAWSLPDEMLIRHGESKWPLRQVLYRYVPKELIDRPKMGFGIPIDQWLRGPLREWAEDLLNPHSIGQYGLIKSDAVWGMWRDHVSGKTNYQYHLWDVIMLQNWCRRFM